uniref:ATP synthase complex subunit 8 n=1 Tax=Kalotermitidae sp. 4 AB-2022a TaxID=2942736 RepID=A0A8X8M2D8_9NEOP|nr:ATP synthase F0 subunit 8 [Kalotermitidae sp. 4 AB-2022a]
MPQMMPLSWLTLFIMFSATLILFNSTNFYTSIMKTSITQKKTLTTKKLNWKW